MREPRWEWGEVRAQARGVDVEEGERGELGSEECVCVFIKFNNGEQTIIMSHRGLFDSVNRTHSRVWGVFFVWSVLFSAWGVLCNGEGESVGAHA